MARPRRSAFAAQLRNRSVLVPLDGTLAAEHALPLALAIAHGSGARIRLLHLYADLASAYEPLPPRRGAAPWPQQRRRIYLSGLLDRLASVSAASVTPSLCEATHDPAAVIAAEAKATAGLIVMAAPATNWKERWRSAKSAASLLSETSVPLLAVPASASAPDLSSLPPLERVLIPLDGSMQAEEALEPAMALGDLAGAECTLLRATSPAPDAARGWGGEEDHAESERQHAEAERYLRSLGSRLSCQCDRVRWRTVREEGSLARIILAQARAERIDLIALATRRRSRLSRWLRPGVVEQVLRSADRPVLVVTAGP